jgi:hypothetical protein
MLCCMCVLWPSKWYINTVNPPFSLVEIFVWDVELIFIKCCEMFDYEWLVVMQTQMWFVFYFVLT